jgi:hypothetical protein
MIPMTNFATKIAMSRLCKTEKEKHIQDTTIESILSFGCGAWTPSRTFVLVSTWNRSSMIFGT